MSTFETKVYKLQIVAHPNADAIELAKVGDYVSIVKKGDFKTGDLGVYIPEEAIVPDWMLKEMGLQGKLKGSGNNRVKAIRLRGTLSQGLIYPVKYDHTSKRPIVIHPTGLVSKTSATGFESHCHWADEGMDVSEFLGITKYEPVLPQHMRGKAAGINLNITINFDVENIKKHNEVIKEGEFVGITEKIHGTNFQFAYVPKRLSTHYLELGCYAVTSKGLGAKGIILDSTDKTNVYTRAVNDPRFNLPIKLPCIKGEYKDLIGDNPIYFVGEIFGPGVQKGFGYGIAGDDIGLRLFDIAYGERSDLKYFDFNTFVKICKNYELPMVPILYVGPFTKKILETCTKGNERVSGKQIHMREGCVTRPLKERYDYGAGRVILKSISEEYLLRSGEATEYA